MDPQRLKDAYERLQILDDRLTYRLRQRPANRGNTEQLEDRVRDLSEYVVDLKEILNELFLAIASKPRPAAPPAGNEPAN
jgi:hypothetical protein